MRFMDSGAAAFGKEERLQKLSAKPSEILRRQLRVTPIRTRTPPGSSPIRGRRCACSPRISRTSRAAAIR
uniref:Uncharacterized protein n=1 Tax=Phenylobacterium glaciei TaxID=2803784 RepID=A0A974P3S8_9CAUL|nr:hypothetical protein JKL49_24375 [Phenylobacterium glaciei]